MAIYLIMFTASTLILHCEETYKMNRKIRSVLVFIAILLPSLLAGLRSYEIGSDTAGYGVYWFNQAMRYNNWLQFIKYAKEYSIDYGYATLNYIASRIGNDAHIFFFLLCFLELYLLYFTAKWYFEKKAVAIVFLIYYFLYFNDSMNNMRQFPAVLIVLYAYRFIKEKNFLFFIVCVALASTFHVTALFAIVLYPIAWMANNRFSKLNLIFVTVAILAASFSFELVFNMLGSIGINMARYEHYIYDSEGGGKFIRLILFGGIWILYYLNKEKHGDRFKDGNTFLFYSTISFASTSLMFIGLSNYIIRLSYYFDFFVLLYLPSIVKIHGTVKVENGRIKIGTVFIEIMAMLFFYWLITYVIRNGADTVPYKFFWS